MDLSEVRVLQETEIKGGERWVFSAGFNVKPDGNMERVDSEVDDILYITNKGGSVVILSHQGSKPEEVGHLDFVVDYLSGKLGKKVVYFPENSTEKAVKFSECLDVGEVGIFGNTRFNDGEKKNDPGLARKFARLASGGGGVAVGGWNKAHRKHASNVGILDFLSGYLTENHIREMLLLEPWAGRSESYSVAVLGGVKKEKITEGLVGFAETYDAIIPGGIVLNTILAAQGHNIGDSVVEDDGKRYVDVVRGVLEKHRDKICIPEKLIIARKNGKKIDVSRVDVGGHIPLDWMIVDFLLPDSAYRALDKVVEGGRLVLAGTPNAQRFDRATKTILPYMSREEVKAIVLGGDTVAETGFSGTTSTGGGASLSYLVNGTTEVYEALKRNKQRFPD